MTKVFGAIEFGGTKTKVLVARNPNQIISRNTIPTQSPGETIAAISNFFQQNISKGNLKLSKVGIGCFGPLDLNPTSEHFGFITTTPKKGWKLFNIKTAIEGACNVPVTLETDVNAAAWGEFQSWKKSVQNLAYITIGTGIGAGIIINRELVHGLVHPEFGHIRIPRDLEIDPYSGHCPYHKDCLEGLASGPSIENRFHVKPESLSNDHPFWQIEADYLSSGLVNLICTISPELIVLGGGIMNREYLFHFIRKKTRKKLNGYIKSPRLNGNLKDYIITPVLNTDSGVFGALYLAMEEEIR